jgi:hypothetical protein
VLSQHAEIICKEIAFSQTRRILGAVDGMPLFGPRSNGSIKSTSFESNGNQVVPLNIFDPYWKGETAIRGEIPSWIVGRRNLTQSGLQLLNPKPFYSEYKQPTELSKLPYCVGRVRKIDPEPGLQIKTRARSQQSCVASIVPLYCTNRHSPLLTNNSFTIYFESESQPIDGVEPGCLTLGFVTISSPLGMPGSDRASLGINWSKGQMHVDGHMVAQASTPPFEPGQRLGIGMKFSKNSSGAQLAGDATLQDLGSRPTIDVEVFFSSGKKKAGSWKLHHLLEAPDRAAFSYLEGSHDLYAAIGTSGEVVVNVLFEEIDWKYNPYTAC